MSRFFQTQGIRMLTVSAAFLVFAGAALAVDRYHRLQADLEIASDPDHAGVDRPGRHTVAEIVGDRRRELCLDDRNEMIDEVGELKILDLGFQVGHAVLQRAAVGEHLRHVDVLFDEARPGGNLITDLAGHGDRSCP